MKSHHFLLTSEFIIILISIFAINELLLGVSGKRDGNQKFKACCARQKAADKSCKRKFCDFESLSQDNVLFFLNTCSVKGSTVVDVWDCATSKKDHFDCCKKRSYLEENPNIFGDN
ncbi:DB module domain-containing protein [Ditylenchus destructor]|nr:DB module domain-containing protein [Ditylenchus destructor]